MLKYEPEKIRYGSKDALTGRLICSRCGRALKQYKGPNKVDWRCRRRSYEKKSITKENQGACPCRIVKDEDVKEAIIEAFNRLPSYRDSLIREQGALRDGEIKRIDLEIESNRERQKRLIEQLAEEEENAFVSEELDMAEGEEMQLTLERAEAALKEVKIRFLLELIDTMTGRGKEKKPVGAACSDYDDFFERTRYKPEEGVLVGGKLKLFDNDLVIRFVDHVIVNDYGYEIVFKAGLEIFIKVC